MNTPNTFISTLKLLIVIKTLSRIEHVDQTVKLILILKKLQFLLMMTMMLKDIQLMMLKKIELLFLLEALMTLRTG